MNPKYANEKMQIGIVTKNTGMKMPAIHPPVRNIAHSHQVS
jgi:hypothetical protein